MLLTNFIKKKQQVQRFHYLACYSVIRLLVLIIALSCDALAQPLQFLSLLLLVLRQLTLWQDQQFFRYHPSLLLLIEFNLPVFLAQPLLTQLFQPALTHSFLIVVFRFLDFQTSL